MNQIGEKWEEIQIRGKTNKFLEKYFNYVN